jgi:hypothetical protein
MPGPPPSRRSGESGHLSAAYLLCCRVSKQEVRALIERQTLIDAQYAFDPCCVVWRALCVTHNLMLFKREKCELLHIRRKIPHVAAGKLRQYEPRARWRAAREMSAQGSPVRWWRSIQSPALRIPSVGRRSVSQKGGGLLRRRVGYVAPSCRMRSRRLAARYSRPSTIRRSRTAPLPSTLSASW